MTGGYRQVLRDRAFLHLAATNVAMIAVGWGVFTWVVPPYARNDLGIGAPLLGLLLLANAATVVLAQVPIARFAEGRRRVLLIAVAAILFVAACLLVLTARRGAGLAYPELIAADDRGRPRRVLPHDRPDAARGGPGAGQPARPVHGVDRLFLVDRPGSRPDAGNATARLAGGRDLAAAARRGRGGRLGAQAGAQVARAPA